MNDTDRGYRRMEVPEDYCKVPEEFTRHVQGTPYAVNAAQAEAAIPQITEFMKRLDKTIVANRQMIEQLHEKLNPLLRPRPGSCDREQDKPGPRPPLAPMAAQISDLAGVLEGGNAILRMLYETLEI